MGWTTAGDLNAQLARLWARGELLRPLVGGATPFPLRLTLRGPASRELTDSFEAVRHWAGELAALPHLRIEWREVRHRIQGQQRLPAQVWVDSLDAAAALLGRRRDVQRLTRVLELTRAAAPELLPWLERRPLQALGHADRWPQLIAVVHWLATHPRPGIYLRQVDIPGIDSKFIEGHRAILAELFDLALPDAAVRRDRAGLGQFASRYGFRDKPARIRFRVLDGDLRLLPGALRPDIALDAESFAGLDLPVRHVVVTENETNFLALPATAGAIAIFGAGYGWEALAQARWLSRCRIHYWGDIDTHGFAILDRLRDRFGHAVSFLMDRETLMAHRPHWSEEPVQVLHDLEHLTGEERALFDDLRDNRIGTKLRLEQERVGFDLVAAAMQRLEQGAAEG